MYFAICNQQSNVGERTHFMFTLWIKNGILVKIFIYGLVLQLINPAVEIKMVENTPDDPRQRKPDITKAKELLGWEPKIKLRDGLPLMEEDFRLRLGVPNKN